ncbi:hypothetical protein ACJX0J_028140, partial [Zea mays]
HTGKHNLKHQFYIYLCQMTSFALFFFLEEKEKKTKQKQIVKLQALHCFGGPQTFFFSILDVLENR